MRRFSKKTPASSSLVDPRILLIETDPQTTLAPSVAMALPIFVRVPRGWRTLFRETP